MAFGLIAISWSRYTSASVQNITVPLDFRNTWRFSAGVDFKPTPCWILRAGTAYDQSPVKSADTRTFRLPDSNRYWLAVGAGYEINKSLTIDAGYSHLFIKDV